MNQNRHGSMFTTDNSPIENSRGRGNGHGRGRGRGQGRSRGRGTRGGAAGH